MIFGDFKIHIIPDTEFRLDGGAMFGIVPRVVWEQVSPPDALNRVRLNMNCVLVETPTERILIETGIGEKWSPEMTSRLGISRRRPFAQSLFETTGYKTDDITTVVNTHLHFDHAGGNTVFDEEFNAVPQFRNARYLVSESEFRAAENPSDRDRASYLSDDWRPLIRAGMLELMPDKYEVVRGITLETVRGHSATMQIWRIDAGGRALVGFADLIPTTNHLRSSWIMGYDLYPVEAVEAKKRLVGEALANDWECVFYHDPEIAMARLVRNGKDVNAVPSAK